ncbi:MAG: GAF domain-containing protein [Chloroflexi bacterium]|nr:MAG: GAF domain-containing protein [Chloroflexota bacterium]MBL1194100.1 GAF domain-containing protein [Chloroflexota bacterium]NOH11394.1 GAF domain-containing protein [Chloroflexota bacterium]
MELVNMFTGRGDTDPIGVQGWRERILQVFLYIILVLGTLAYILNVIDLVQSGEVLIALFYTGAYGIILAISLVRQIPYRVRTATLLIITYGLSIQTLTTFGLSSDGRVWMIFFIVLSGILLGLREGLIATFISAITYALIAVALTGGVLPLPSIEDQANSGSSSAWLATGVVLLLTALLIVFAVGVLIRGLQNSLGNLEKSLETEKELSDQLEEDRATLERRTQTLERRMLQLRTASEISGIIVEILDPQELMQRVCDLIRDRFALYYVGVFLLDDSKRYAELATGTGEAGRRMVAEAHRLSVGGASMVGWTTARREARTSSDVDQESIHFNNPHLPLTRSELALPLVRANEVLGALTVQSVDVDAFDTDDITVLQGIASTLANAMENARLFQQLETSLNEIRNLNRSYLNEAWSGVDTEERDLSYTLENILPGQSGDASSLDVPLTLRGEQVIGKISLEADKSNWSQEELEFIDAVSSQAALALESARLLEETQRQVEREQTLNQITNQLARTLDFDTLMQNIVRELGQLPNVSEVSIHVAPPDDVAEQNGDGAASA